MLFTLGPTWDRSLWGATCLPWIFTAWGPNGEEVGTLRIWPSRYGGWEFTVERQCPCGATHSWEEYDRRDALARISSPASPYEIVRFGNGRGLVTVYQTTDKARALAQYERSRARTTKTTIRLYCPLGVMLEEQSPDEPAPELPF